MKNPQKAQIWDLIDYLVSELECIVELKYDEVTIYNRYKGKHNHYRYNYDNILEVLRKATLDFEKT